MKITVEFDTEEEFKARIKNPRGSKAGSDDDTPANSAPAPLQPPQSQPGAFTPPPQQQPFQPSQGFPGAGAPTGGDPAVAAIVGRIVARIDGAVASGQPADAVLAWFRGRCGAEAANATMDQIKHNFLPKLAMPVLEDIAKLMNA